MGQLFKNVASQKVRVFAFADAGHASLDAGEPVTGDAANISARVAVDNAALAASNDTAPTEIDATNAPGFYEFDPTQAETNGDVVEWYPKSSTAGVQVITVGGNVQTTQPPNFPALGIESDGDVTKVNTLDGHTAQTGDSYARLGAPAGASVSADIATVDGNVDAILVDTGTTIPATLGSPAGADMSADIAAVKSETAAIVADTNELQVDWANGGRLDLLIDAIKTVTDALPDSGALTSLATAAALTTVDGVVDAIKVITDALGATAAARLALSAGVMVPGTVDTATNSHTPTTTEFQADDITEATADHFNGRVVIFTSGVLINQATDITDYVAVGGIGQFTVTALTEAPSNNDTFIVI